MLPTEIDEQPHSRPRILWARFCVREDTPQIPLDQLDSCSHLRFCTDVAVVGSDALQYRPALICFEFDYPDAAGLEMLQTVKEALPHVPVLMLTAHSSEALVLWAFRTGVRDYLKKPLAAAALRDCVLGLLQLSELNASSARGVRRNLLAPTPRLPVHRRAGGQSHFQRTQAALTYMRAHLQDKITLSTVAERCHLGVFSFARLFKREHGITFVEMLIKLRIDYAKELLANPNLSMIEVASAAGFTDTSSFARAFRKHLRLTPRQFRDAQQPGCGYGDAANDGMPGGSVAAPAALEHWA